MPAAASAAIKRRKPSATATREKGRQKKNVACILREATPLVGGDTLPQRVKTDDYFRNGVVFVLPQKNTKEEPVHIHLQRGQKVRLWNHDLPEEVYIIWAISRPSNGTAFSIVVSLQGDPNPVRFTTAAAAITEVIAVPPEVTEDMDAYYNA